MWVLIYGYEMRSTSMSVGGRSLNSCHSCVSAFAFALVKSSSKVFQWELGYYLYIYICVCVRVYVCVQDTIHCSNWELLLR